MAMWRNTMEEPPARLRVFDPADWTGQIVANPWYYTRYGLGPAYKTPYEIWHLARLEWLKADPDRRIDGMDAVDCILCDEG
jgi:hypothetical protein